MTADQPGLFTITGDQTTCEEGCVSGTFNWIPGDAVQELLSEVVPDDHRALVEMLAEMGHHVLGVVAASVLAYDYSADDSALEKAQELVRDAIISLQAELGIMQMEAELDDTEDEDPESDEDN